MSAEPVSTEQVPAATATVETDSTTRPHPTLVRYLLDMRHILPNSLPLALLPESTHAGITKFFHHSDRKLAFGSQVLQRLLVCRVLFGADDDEDEEEDVPERHHMRATEKAEKAEKKAKKGLKDIEIERDEQSGRPSYNPPPVKVDKRKKQKLQRILEDYNVSHSSGIVIIAARVSEVPVLPAELLSVPQAMVPVEYKPRKRKIGVDVVPTFHSPRTGDGAGVREATDEENEQWINGLIGADVYTPLEERTILGQSDSRRRVRCLYLFWALKEAYVKAVGTGIVTNLLGIEFRNVRLFDIDEGKRKCTDFELWVDGQKKNDWYLEVTAYGESEPSGEATHYLAVASEVEGIRAEDGHAEWEILDFEKDVLPFGPFGRMGVRMQD